MKISTTCSRCSIEAYEQQSLNINIEGHVSIEENDLYFFRCSKGHVNLLEIQAFKFELLYESGLCAIKSDYYLESVLSLTASVERFYEFFIKIVLSSEKIEKSIIEKMYKEMSRQSERQIGAFLALYVMAFKEPPSILNQKAVEFRNSVVHKGYFPTKEEVLRYAKDVFELIQKLYVILRKKFETEIGEQISLEQQERREKNKDKIEENNVNITLLAPPFALSHILELSAFEKKTFEESFDLVMSQDFYH
ncbi:hypothetical protein [Flectobacillus roseus]|uniref:Apea-like HEPN domain-containing protein n=1 Tax=Flectobacillus roseus TaxID=502259 RepID=A0ABT6Y357_9BACT|nr:hypothetical protein [Flectobacillus roseus]MDI9858008.1 hypothetical protein [Flectobacillus roseus]